MVESMEPRADAADAADAAVSGGIAVAMWGARPDPPEPPGELPPVERSEAPTIPGVRIGQMEIADFGSPPLRAGNRIAEWGTPGAKSGVRGAEPPAAARVVARPGRVLGNHFHLRRAERIALLSGSAEVRLMDCRFRTAGFGAWNCFAVARPGLGIEVPAGVAHAVRAGKSGAVLQVLGSRDDSEDEVPVTLFRG